MKQLESDFAGLSLETLTKEMAEAETYLSVERPKFAEHIISSHSGWIAFTCHKCGTFQQGIQSNLRVIEEAKMELTRLGKL